MLATPVIAVILRATRCGTHKMISVSAMIQGADMK